MICSAIKGLYRFTCILAFQFILTHAFSQPYGNEWVVNGQKYYKLLVYQTGIYQVSGQQLLNAGVPINSWDPTRIQLWHRGVEQAVQIQGIQDGVFDPSDRMVFYGQRNDGTLDSLLYEPYSAQPHKYFNLFSDTSVYFLTEGTNPGMRIGEPAFTGLSANTSYHWQEELLLYTTNYSDGEGFGETYLSSYGRSEGWTGPFMYKGSSDPPVSSSFSIPLSGVVSSGSAATLQVILLGENSSGHNVSIVVGDPSSPVLTYTVPNFVGFVQKDISITIPVSALTGASLNVTVTASGFPNYADEIAVSLLKLTYPQTIDMGGENQKQFIFDEVKASQTVTVSSYMSGTSFFDISDPSQVAILPDSAGSGTTKLYLPSTAWKVLAVTPAAMKSVYAIRPANCTSYLSSNNQVSKAQFIIITHRTFSPEALDYAAYRASSNGGKYDTLVAFTDNIYDQFSYGEMTPLAIRNFCRYLYEQGNPKYLFIIGKGVDVGYQHYLVGDKYYRFQPQAYWAQINTFNYVFNFVPNYGSPNSDLMYVMGLGNNPKNIPAFPVGRLNAKYPADVSAYLDKVKTQEALPKDLLWRKDVLHLSGGDNEGQILDFAMQLDQVAHYVEDTVFCGKVVAHIVKALNSYVDNQLIQTVAEYVNKGLSYVTFLGHASPSVADIDIGYVSNPVLSYDNPDKYPMLLLNGCNFCSGMVPYSLADNWLQTPNRGAISTIGHASYGYTYLFRQYIEAFYRYSFSQRSTFIKHLSVGDIQKEVVQYLSVDVSKYNQAMLQQMILQGDPAIHVYEPPSADYSIVNSFVSSFNREPVTAISDSFQLAVVVDNFGISSGDSVLISVKRTFGSTTLTYQEYFPSVKYQDTLYLTIKRGTKNSYGENSFVVTVNPLQTIPEYDQTNNTYSFQHFMPLSAVATLFPIEFSIVNKQPVTFVAQGTDLLLTDKVYYLELDTSAWFNSPFKKSVELSGGPLIKWENVSLLPDIPMYDSVVYYWRARFKDIPPGQDTTWGQSSFIYIDNGPEGWSQSTIFQLDKDGFANITPDLMHRKLVFDTMRATLTAYAPGDQYVGPDKNQPSYYYTQLGLNGDGILFENRGGCPTGVIALTMDKSTLVPYWPMQGPLVCGWAYSGKRVNDFANMTDSSSVGIQSQLIRYIDSVKSGDYVLLMNKGDAHYEDWGTALKNKIKSAFGARFIDSLTPGMGYILLARKDSSKPIAEYYSSTSSMASLNTVLTGVANSGTVSSTLIGPASSWGKFYKQFTTSAGDYYNIQIIGQDINGNEDTLTTVSSQDSLNLAFINASQYPYLKLVASISDSSQLTPLDLSRWMVTYKGVPEGTMDAVAAGLAQFKYVTKQEGDSVRLRFVFKNIYSLAFPDILKVEYSITNAETGKIKSDTVSLVKLAVGDSVVFSYAWPTVGWAGHNHIQAYVNPMIQPEQYYNNNILEMDFYVEADVTNPVLDVTFDGQHIVNGDIVSPSPYIVISLRDENKYLIMNDTTGMQLFLQRPCQGCGFLPIDFTNPDILHWGQSSTKTNNFQIDYNPKKLADGMYKLRVQGADVSGNKSGSVPYEIEFQVINESSITNFYPYPNPFSTHTQFIFTLTGEEIPQDIQIQIMTVSGTVVREITKVELGPIHIGNNITQYAWDGRDQFGDLLANGLYLYQVRLKGANDFKHRKTAGDKAFKKNIGKIYILR